jgi:hypothetical protein
MYGNESTTTKGYWFLNVLQSGSQLVQQIIYGFIFVVVSDVELMHKRKRYRF